MTHANATDKPSIPRAEVAPGENPPVDKIQKYYRWHAPIYDATRWSFLFGRRSLIRALPRLQSSTAPAILEIGCGTGQNLLALQRRYPQAHITGIDLSRAMLRKAASKTTGHSNIRLIHAPYEIAQLDMKGVDLVLLSYSLTILSNPVRSLLHQVVTDLHPEGYVAVVDFHRTPVDPFRRWMKYNNVSLDGKLLPELRHYFSSTETHIKQAYFGLWSYFQFIGRPKMINAPDPINRNK